MNRDLSGILLVDKAKGSTSFSLVALLRRISGLEKIGHAGTLDPFATGLMVMLIGRKATLRSNEFLCSDKQYRATLRLGEATDTYDLDGQITATSPIEPSLSSIEKALLLFQGECQQTPPMFSAKKIKGKKLYHLARKGIVVERTPIKVQLATTFLSYQYPFLELEITCSKGTYIRSIAHDLGQILGCGAHLTALTRLRSGSFSIKDAIEQPKLLPGIDLTPFLKEVS